MAGERILYRLERDIGLTLLLLISGLLYSYRGSRGYPVPWLTPYGPHPEYFLLSLVILFCAVFCIDLVVTAVLLVREPSADRQTAETSVIVNSVDYAEYEDDYDKEYSYTEVSEYEISDEEEVTISSMFRDLGLKDRTEQKKSAGDSDKKPGNRSGKKSSSAATVIAVIAIIASLIGSCIGFFDDADDGYDGDWDTENIAIDDDPYAVEYNNMFDLASDAIYNIGADRFSDFRELFSENVYNDISEEDFDTLYSSDINWADLWFRNEIGVTVTDDDKYATAVYRLYDDADNAYIAIFNYTGDNLSLMGADFNDSIDCSLTGFSISPDVITAEYGYDPGLSDVDSDELDDFITEMQNDAVSIGTVSSEDYDILSSLIG